MTKKFGQLSTRCKLVAKALFLGQYAKCYSSQIALLISILVDALLDYNI